MGMACAPKPVRALMVGRRCSFRNARCLVEWWKDEVMVLLNVLRVRMMVEGDWDREARVRSFSASVLVSWKIDMILIFLSSSW